MNRLSIYLLAQGGTPDATAPSAVGSSTAPSPTSELGRSTPSTVPNTTTDSATAATPHFGISMVQGPPITGLDVPLPETSPPSRPRSLTYAEVATYLGPTASHLIGNSVEVTARSADSSSAAHSRSNTPTSGSSARYGGYSEVASTTHRRELDEVTDYNRGITMKPVKDEKVGISQPAATETTTEDGSGGTPDATAPSAVGSSTAPSPTSELGRSTPSTVPNTTTDSATAATPHFGISMVQGPPITGLDVPLPETSPPSRPRSLTYAEVATYLGPTASHLIGNSVEVTARSADSSSAAHSRSNTPTSGSSARYGGYSEVASTTHRRELDEVTDYNRGITTSPTPSEYTLDKEVQLYVKRRDSAFYDYYPGTERDNYDYVAERNVKYTTNLVEATAHMIKGSLGAAVLSMHEAYMIGGLWTSLAVTVVVGFLVGYTMFMLIRSAQKMYRRVRIHKLSYPDLAEAAAATAPWNWVRKKSKAFRYTVEVSLFLHLCGTCCIYQIVIAHSMRQIIDGFHSDISAWLSDIRIYILITTPLLIPLCLIRSIKFLAPFALIADIFVAICVFATLYYSLLAFEVHIEERAAWKDAHGFIRVCGICMYGTSGICVALPVENNMRRPQYFSYVVRYATAIVILLSVMTGFFGYWAWGEDCKSPITVHMPLNTFTTVLQVLLVMMLSTTFAVNFWVPFRIVWHYVMRKHKRKLPCWERIYRVLMAILVMGAAMVAPHTIPVMIFVGQFFLGFIGLVFPAFIEFFVDWEEEYASRARVRFVHVLKNFGLVILGLILTLSTIYSVRDVQ